MEAQAKNLAFYFFNVRLKANCGRMILDFKSIKEISEITLNVYYCLSRLCENMFLLLGNETFLITKINPIFEHFT